MKKTLIVCLLLAIGTVACEELFSGDELTSTQIAIGLKEALNQGADVAVSRLAVEDGYFQDELVKILLPAEAQPVYNVVNSIPLLSNLVDETILAINRSAEDAANEAKPIFVDAIAEMTIEDALGILHGGDTSATSYLRQKTYQSLFDAFKPKVQASLDKDLVFGISAEESYTKLINSYNAASLNGLLFAKIQENSLTEHATNKALKGLFQKVGTEEVLIREDASRRLTETMQQVFAEQD